ncbi:MAG: hypothetical protein Q7K43_05970, partial [Candidatus Woesearchaeota archaeon]|nr:hypothetical protein [Candidatus Woesearchaeota archaeon]
EYTGNRARELIYFEANCSDIDVPSKANFGVVNRFDYFVLSDIDVSALSQVDGSSTVISQFPTTQTDNTGFTHVLKYEEYSNSTRVATFTDLASGTKQVSITPNQNQGTLIVGGTNYLFEIVGGANNAETNNANISVDVDGDGNICHRHRTALTTEGGLLILFGAISQMSNGATPPVQGTAINSFSSVNAMPVSFTTLSKQFDSGTTNLVENLLINATSAAIRMEQAQMTNFSFRFLTSEPEIAQYLDKYGIQWELFDPLTSDSPEEITAEVPISQRGVQVFLTSGDVQREQSTGGESQRINPLPVGIAKLASQVSDLTKLNAIVVGGPCANPAAAKLLGNPEPCTKGFEKGKATLKLFEHSTGNVALLVAGYAGDDTWRASRALATGTDLKNAKADKEAVVSGSTLSDVTVKAA